MNHPWVYILVGIAAGALSGVFGLGGGIIIIPILVYLFGFSQHLAQGTTLAMMVPPIGLLAAAVYYRKGYVDVSTAAFLCLGFFIGSVFGGAVATAIPEMILKRLFGLLMLVISIKMMVGK
ncbi:MAG: sulfite exporter TauE/SafE family protein [Lentisphaerota bacterium]